LIGLDKPALSINRLAYLNLSFDKNKKANVVIRHIGFIAHKL